MFKVGDKARFTGTADNVVPDLMCYIGQVATVLGPLADANAKGYLIIFDDAMMALALPECLQRPDPDFAPGSWEEIQRSTGWKASTKEERKDHE